MPAVWQMVKEAVDALGSPTTNGAVRDWILEKYPGTNPGTISHQIIFCTVNHDSRIHDPQNKAPRHANGPRDFLFRPRRRHLEIYDPAEHGVWAIVGTQGGNLAVRQLDESSQLTAADGPPAGSATRATVSRQPRASSYRPKPVIEANIEDLLANLPYYYEKSLSVSREFGGPSEYFHRKAIEASYNEFLSNRHLEYVYAALCAWGMHRMGDSKCKMTDFDKFAASIESVRTELTGMRELTLASCTDDELEEALVRPIRQAFETLAASVSDVSLVANSKALHHILPRLVPVVDRRHTLNFLYQEQRHLTYINSKGKITWRQSTVPKPVARQYAMFQDAFAVTRRILRSPQSSTFRPLRDTEAPFNTSLPKIVDNMVIILIKEKGVQRGAELMRQETNS